MPSRPVRHAVMFALLLALVSPGAGSAVDPEQPPSPEQPIPVPAGEPAGTPSPQPTPLGPGGEGTSLDGPTSFGYPIDLPRDGTILVQVSPNESSSSIDDLSLEQPTQQFLVGDAARQTIILTLGTFTAGTDLVFSLTSSLAGQTFLSTGDHVRILQNGPEMWALDWEDLTDFDYDDVHVKVCYEQPGVGGCSQPAAQSFGPSGGGYTKSQAEPVNTEPPWVSWRLG